MNKIFIGTIIMFCVLISTSFILIIDKDNEKIVDLDTDKLKILNNIDKKIDYFNYEYLDRYISYKEKNSNLDDVDVVTRVNIGLDYPFYENTRVSNNLNKITILVNKYIYLDRDYVPDNLVSIDRKYARNNIMLVLEAKESYEDMAASAYNDGYTIRAISGYRSYDYQKQLYDKYVSYDGVDAADTYSARAGYSEHQTGLVVDIDNGLINYEDFEGTDSFKWMQENSYLYGFILRYPSGKEDITGYSYESWHYRYVGKEIATFIKDNNITYDEYYVRYIEKGLTSSPSN